MRAIPEQTNVKRLTKTIKISIRVYCFFVFNNNKAITENIIDEIP